MSANPRVLGPGYWGKMHQLPPILSSAVGLQHYHRLDDSHSANAICMEITDLAGTEIWHKLYLLYRHFVCEHSHLGLRTQLTCY